MVVLAVGFAVDAGGWGQDAPPPQGKVLFSREQGQAPAQETPKAGTAAPVGAEVTDAEREALVFTAYDLDVHLAPARSEIGVRARWTVRNSGSVPLKRLAFQISSSLRWESFGLENDGKVDRLEFGQQVIDTDADHTGKAQEAVVTLPQALEPGASVVVSAFYEGKIERSAERLERIGAPADQAGKADWDRVSPELTAVRGFGNVLWYPVASAPAFLGDGAKLFQAVGRTRRLQAEAKTRLRLTVEYVGDPPDMAFFCGRRQKLKAVSENENVAVVESPGVATAEFAEQPLGFRGMSLFVTDRAATATEDGLVEAVTDHYDALPIYAAAASKTKPLLKDWLGIDPLEPLRVIDVDGQPFEDDSLLVMPMQAVGGVDALTPALLHSLTHAWFRSRHVWLDEGVAQFMSLLWVEQMQGRDAAVARLQEQARTVAVAEPVIGQDTKDVGQSLIDAEDEIHYRMKAGAVLWMLRSIVGEDALKQALKNYRAEEGQDGDPKLFQRVVERSAHKDLGWFFDDWVYRDRGLPDLSIASVTPRALETAKGTSWLISVVIQNDGDAAAEVPVTLRSGKMTATETVRVMGRSSASTRMVFVGEPDEVIVNDGGVPEISASVHTRQVVAK